MTAPLRLWEISEELDALVEKIVEQGGELSAEDEESLGRLSGAFESKIEGIALHVRNCIANAKAAKVEADRMSAIQRAFENTAKRLKNYALAYMKAQDVQKVETNRCKVRIQTNSRPSIKYMGEPGTAPQEYRILTASVDMGLAYEQWKAGDELPDGFVVETGEHLRVA